MSLFPARDKAVIVCQVAHPLHCFLIRLEIKIPPQLCGHQLLPPINRATPAQASAVAPFTGLKSFSTFPATRQLNDDITSVASNGGRVQCMQVWPPTGKKKFETLSYLPPLSSESLAKEVDYLLRQGWVPCLEFDLEHGFVYRENHRSPGYQDGRYWTM
ncbi:hypothetical protein Patl1_14965 [Pistacia atlantica]|uniref:Uncharacterized protein n=1 Tax=Pistacia atlantica TaxID=434234 RepID=A0ACC1B8L4_9ROSI|nr:hypothetical protein Patl1_14965 [Pistacia atlantica]